MFKVLKKKSTPSGSCPDDQHHLWTMLETGHGARNLNNLQDSDAEDSIVLDTRISEEDDDLDKNSTLSDSSDKTPKLKDSVTNPACAKRMKIRNELNYPTMINEHDEELETSTKETVLSNHKKQT